MGKKHFFADEMLCLGKRGEEVDGQTNIDIQCIV